MAFAPGQFITAARLNRLQPTTYWAQASSTVTTPVGTAADVPGTSMSITVQTNGATASFMWSGVVYATGTAMTSNIGLRPFWDVNGAPNFVVIQWSGTNEKGTGANFWQTTIPTAGTYTFKLNGTLATNSEWVNYTSHMVTITEVA